ncbi:MAG TPA: hypothetical protein VMZ53_19785 [Kofleriaceae bacterium]|nr:hypothetical protein [Kofleriaceae bacterium]
MVTKALFILAVVVCGLAGTAAAQAPQKITIGIYAPTVEFGTAQARLAYVQGLAKAIEQNTGIKTEAQSYASIAALKKDNVDFAIIDGPCYATNLSWKLLANANIGGGTTRQWALFSSAGDTMQALKGKKLAFVAMGCNDNGFIDNAMLESEVDDSFFGARVGEKELTGALASVTSYKTAQAVFAPTASAKGLSKVFETGAVPNPAFVEVAGKLPAGTSDKVAAAVVGYGGSGAINGWTKATKDVYQSFAGRLSPVKKAGVFASPEPVRIDAKDVLVDPATLKDSGMVAIRHHFVRPPGSRMD